MGNFFSQFFDSIDNISNAPSGAYTITPSLDITQTTSTHTSADSTQSAGTSQDIPSSETDSTTKTKCSKKKNKKGSTVTTTTTTSTSNNLPTRLSNTPGENIQLERNKEDDENKFMEFLDTIFNATTYTIIFWILVAYGFYGLGKAIYKNKGSMNESSGIARYSRIIDLIIMFLFGSFLFSVYYRLEEEDKTNILGYTIEWTHDYFNNPWAVFELIWFTIIFFALVYVLKVPMLPDVKPLFVHFIEKKIWIVYALFAAVFFFKYVLNIPVLDLLFNNSVMNYFKDVQPYSSSESGNGSPSVFDSITKNLNMSQDIYDNDPLNEEDCDVTESGQQTPGQQTPGQQTPGQQTPGQAPGQELNCTSIPVVSDHEVFNVSNNVYSYEEAQKVCSAFDASLATYDQIERSYRNGGEWCNYGWSDGQMAFFPTQKKTWETLQKSEGTKHACGRPGINGGFIDNPYVRFGANCYGKKPERPDDWGPINYTTDCGVEKEDPNQKIRDEAKLNSFNQKNWSRY